MELELLRRENPALTELPQMSLSTKSWSSSLRSAKSTTPRASKEVQRSSKDVQKASNDIPRASKDVQKASKDDPAEVCTAEGDRSDQTPDLPESAAAAKPPDAGSEDNGSQSTEPQSQTEWNLARTYAVTLYSADLSQEKAPRTKARTYAVNLQNDPTPPPPGSGARRRSVDFGSVPRASTARRPSESNAARPTMTYNVWTDSDMLNVKTPEIAAMNGDTQGLIRVAFKPNSTPRRSREYVYIQEAQSKAPFECLGFDLEYI
jgi:hypothetical protein